MTDSLSTISFKADEETRAALARLVDHATQGEPTFKRSRLQSTAIRRAIIAAAKALK